jgi:drug/metabolite transporter (DMT)-like permease
MGQRKPMKTSWRGIGCGLAAGALWGLVFLTPELTAGFTPIQLSAGRYLAYGALAAVLLAPSWRRVRAHLGWREWRALAWLSLLGNTLYYVLLANAVRIGGVAMTSLIIGLLPIAVTTIGSLESGAVPLRRLLPSLLLSAAGTACIGWQSLSGSAHGSLAGLLCAAGALACWTTYAIGNSRWLARLHEVTPHEWSLLTGIVTGAQALALAIPAFVLAPGSHAVSGWLYFTAIVGGIALLCSIVANAFWNRASRLLPLTMIGQMILFETLFALLYGFLWERRLPTLAEAAAMVLLVASVLFCATAHRPEPAGVP